MRDTETRTPLPGVNVIARGADGRVGTSTDADGRFQLTGLSPGSYVVRVTAVGYEPAEAQIDLAAGQTRSLTVALTPRTYALNEIVVSSQPGAARPAFTLQRVQAADIERLDAVDVGELATLIPATHVATNSRGQTILYFRNAGDRQVGQFFDGALLNIPWDNRVDISLVPSSVVGEVAVAKGVVPVAYGPNVIGGAVNFQSRTLDAAGQRTEVSGHAGTAANRHGAITHLGRTDRWDYAAAVQYSERGDLPLPDEAEVPFSQPLEDRRVNTDRQLLSGFARASYRLNGGAQLAVTAMHVDAEQGVAPESHVDPNVDRVRYWRYPLWRKSVLIGSGQAALGARTAIRGAVWGSRFAQDIHQFQTVEYAAFDEIQTDRDWTGGFRLIGTQDLPVGALVLAANGLISRHDQTNIAFADGQEQAPSESSFRQHLLSLGSEYEVDLTPQVTTTVGASVDRSIMADTGPFPERDPFTSIGLTLGVAYDVSDTYRLRASGGRKGRFPTMRELYSGALGKFVPNPDLQPVTAWIGEVGVERRGTRLSGSATLFLNRVLDTIDQRTFTQEIIQDEDLPADFLNKEQRINLDGSRVYGVEASARWQIADDLLFDGHAMWTRPRGVEDDDTQPLEEKPEWLGTGRLSYDLPTGLSVMAQGRYVAGTQARNAQNNYVELPASLVVDARVSYAIDRWVPQLGDGELFARIDNITDEARLLQLGLPGAGRMVRAGVSFAF